MFLIFGKPVEKQFDNQAIQKFVNKSVDRKRWERPGFYTAAAM